MSTPALSEQQADNELILLARTVAVVHWPNTGRCVMCRVARCSAYQLAVEVLQRYSQPPEPILRTAADQAVQLPSGTLTPAPRAADDVGGPGRVHDGAETASPHVPTEGGP